MAAMDDSEDKGPQSPAPGPFGPGSPGYGPGAEKPEGEDAPPPDAPAGPQSPAAPPPPPQAPPPSPEPPAGPQEPAGPQAPAPSGYPPPPPAPGPETMGAPPQAPSYGGPVPPGGWHQPTAPGQPPLPDQGALAGWWSRAGAALIDGLILGVPATILFIVIVGGAVGLSGGDDDVAVGAAIVAFLLWLLLVALVALAYAPVLMMRQGAHNGQSWGKQVIGIRVTRDNGQPFDFWSAAMREIVLKTLALGVASFFIPLIPYLVDYLWPLWDDQNRALHDMAASTHVIRA